MTNPRKFSEKIALHNQKQAEETAAFEQIMKEVMDATVKPGPTPPQSVKQTHLLPTLGAFRGGSLPNVNQMSQQGDKGPSAGRMLYNNQSVSPRSSRNVIGPGPVRVKHRTDTSPYASPPMSHSMSSNPVNIDLPGLTFGTNYLSPPAEPNWRRANSDSALNSINNSLLIPSVVPDSSEESSNNSNDPRETYGLGMGKTQDSPNTGCDGPSLLEIPQSVSTGSLPDLTNFHFPPPLQQPIDMDELNHSYSTSPLTGSSLTYSPSLSPHPPPGVLNHHPAQPLNQSSAQQQQSQVQRPQQQQQRQQQQQQQHTQSQHSPQSLIDNPLHVNTSFQNFSPNDNMLTAYRCPQRPSPQSSPSPFRSASPLEGHLSAPPSPTNQPTQQTSPDTYYLSQQAQALQQHFEQISMVDNTLPQRNNGHWPGGGMVSSATYFYNSVPNPGSTAGVTTQQSPQHPQPQTPQTPSSIPDIIFTDFSDVRASDPVEEYLASEAAAVALREGLGPIDLDGLEMLRDPSLVQLDSNAEDSFRLDRQ